MGRFKAYLQPVGWLADPEFEAPRRGVPKGRDLLQLLRPEGFIREGANGFSDDLPLARDYPPGPSVYPFTGDDESTDPPPVRGMSAPEPG